MRAGSYPAHRRLQSAARQSGLLIGESLEAEPPPADAPELVQLEW